MSGLRLSSIAGRRDCPLRLSRTGPASAFRALQNGLLHRGDALLRSHLPTAHRLFTGCRVATASSSSTWPRLTPASASWFSSCPRSCPLRDLGERPPHTLHGQFAFFGLLGTRHVHGGGQRVREVGTSKACDDQRLLRLERAQPMSALVLLASSLALPYSMFACFASPKSSCRRRSVAVRSPNALTACCRVCEGCGRGCGPWLCWLRNPGCACGHAERSASSRNPTR